MLEGSYTAIVTPFLNGNIDEVAFKKLIDRQIEAKITGIVPCGTTGESPTLSFDEHKKIIDLTVKHVEKRAQVIAGAGSNSTLEAIELARSAKTSGADAILVITPYYNKPTQQGLYLHFKKMAEEVDIPIVLYNVPGRTGVDLGVDTVVRLAEIPGIVAIKEASGSISRASDIINKTDIAVVSGDDSLAYSMVTVGGKGVISVSSNVFPEMVAKMIKYSLNGDLQSGLKLHNKLFGINNKLFVETNPIPVKAALAMMGLIREEYRLPLCKISDKNKAVLQEELNKFEEFKA